MPTYKVSYASLTARYGPSLIEADSPEEAKRKFGRGAFSDGERAVCITASGVSADEMRAALREAEEED